MKKATQFFLVLGCIAHAIFIFPLIIGILAYKTVEKARSAKELTVGTCVCVFIFVSGIAGVLMLLMTDEDLKPKNAVAAPVTASNVKRDMDVYEKLTKLKQLLDDNIISQGVYDVQKAKYLAEL